MASRPSRPVLLLCVLISQVLLASAQTCNNYGFTNNRVYTTCTDLPLLSSYLHWTYHPSNRTVDLAFRKTGVSPSSWVAWAINPTGKGMINAEAFVAYQTGGGIKAYTAPIRGYGTRMQEGNLSFPVMTTSAEYSKDQMTIFASFVLPGKNTTVNQVWQEGPVFDNTLGMHRLTGDNVRSTGTIDFLSGEFVVAKGGNPRDKSKRVHGVLAAVSWGTLMPLGVIFARYLKVVKSAGPAWFYLHIACQTLGYALGVAGFVTGLILGNKSSGVQYDFHRNLGITLAALATLQVSALFCRPKPDGKYRLYWTIYHRLSGYCVIVLSVVNVLKGLDILDPGKKWKTIYHMEVVVLICIAALLEVATLAIVRKYIETKFHRKVTATDGVNGNGVGPQLEV